jgi:hypothetical protein
MWRFGLPRGFILFLLSPGRPSRKAGRRRFGCGSFFATIRDLDVVRRRKAILPVETNQYPIRIGRIKDLQLCILGKRELFVRLPRVIVERASFVDRMCLLS